MTPQDSSPAASAGKSVGRFFWELIKAFLIAVVIIVPIRYFLVQPFFVRGASMEPTYLDGEYLVIDQLSYRFREPRRGEVIVFRYPKQPAQFFIKRIIALPGERVAIHDGQVTIFNDTHPRGVLLDESQYLTDGVRTGGQVEMQLDGDEYFVLGDNRPASSDSRSWGALEKDGIIGRSWVRAYPFDRLDVFELNVPGFIAIPQQNIQEGVL
ncbi:MAG: signal peptidase I [Candidatus Andersenbacteria bacterium]